MSYNSSFTGQQADAALQKAAVIQMDSDGTKFLADDGTYKEAGDKTNVLILSLENDLANGEKDSPITAEVSASLVDAITNGKACVIKSANSDILVNLQQIGSNVTIIMEQISRVGQTFVAVNTSITVNTSTNVIADYQTGALVLETSGDGTKFLADDGAYKAIASSNQYLDMSIFTGESGTLSEENYQKVVDAYNKNYSLAKLDSSVTIPMAIEYTNSTIGICLLIGTYNSGVQGFPFTGIYVLISKLDKSYVIQSGNVVVKTGGSGEQFLSDKGTYKNISEKYSSRTFVLFSSDFAGNGYVLKPIEAPSDWSEQMVITPDNSNTSGFSLTSDVSEDGSKYAARFTYSGTTYPAQGSWKLQNNVTGDIMQILAVVIQSQKVLTGSEYTALGTTPETDGVLYFVTPD